MKYPWKIDINTATGRARTSRSLKILTAFLLVLAVQASRGLQFFDDAFITFRYARNIVEKTGFVYNAGQYVLGTTSPLYTLLLAGLGRIAGVSRIPSLSFWIGVAADAASLVIFYGLAKLTFKSRFAAVVLAGVFLFQPLRLNVSAGGMETSVFIFTLLMMGDRFLRRKPFPEIAIWASLALLTRPDAILAIAPLFGFWLFKEPPRAMRAGILSFVFCLPWMAWAVFYFGSPLPQSLVAKSSTYGFLPAGSAFFYLLTFFASGSIGPSIPWAYLFPGLLIMPPLFLIGLIQLWQRQSNALVFAVYPLVYAVVMAVWNPPLFFAWYYPPLLPGIILLCGAGVWFSTRRPSVRKGLLSTLALFLIVYPTLLMRIQPSFPISRVREQAFWEACDVVKTTIQPGKTLLAPDIGVIGWCLAGTEILDTVGLVSPEALLYLNESVSQGIVSLDLVLDAEPDYILSLDQFIKHIYDAPEFQERYRLVWQKAVSGPGYSSQNLLLYRRRE